MCILSIVKRKNCATLTRIFVCVRIAQYLKNITAESVAESFFVSKWYVNNICKRFYNKSFRQTIIDMRMWYAYNLIAKHPTMTINKIAEMCGYNEYSAFYKAYLNYFGISPKEYNQKNINNDKSD